MHQIGLRRITFSHWIYVCQITDLTISATFQNTKSGNSDSDEITNLRFFAPPQITDHGFPHRVKMTNTALTICSTFTFPALNMDKCVWQINFLNGKSPISNPYMDFPIPYITFSPA